MVTSQFNDVRILVADDSLVQRDHVVGLCRTLGVKTVKGAENGVDAIAKLKTENFDLVFIDLEMPEMDGVELVRNIADQELARAVIILSSKDPVLILSVGTMADAAGLRVLGTFRKPLQPEQLNCSLLRLLQYGQPEYSLNTSATSFSPKDLVEAIRQDQLDLKFQPKVTAGGLLLKGVEALARWEHPHSGNIPPSDFIAVAEKFGLIDTLTYYLYEKALRCKADWKKYGIRVHLAFNLSPLSLGDRGLTDKVIALNEKYGIEAEETVLEITENAVAGEISTAIETLARLRLKGFNIAIDDYGTGFANAQQLSRVPATELKLDRSLIDGVSTRPQQQAIVSSTIGLSEDLGLITVAEGVEHLDDYRFLVSSGIDLIQGYLIAKPMSNQSLLSWIKRDLPHLRQTLNCV